MCRRVCKKKYVQCDIFIVNKIILKSCQINFGCKLSYMYMCNMLKTVFFKGTSIVEKNYQN